MKKFLIILLCIFLQACSNAACNIDFIQMQDGKRAFDSGDFKTAFRKLMPAAVAGNPKAQYAIGYMYYYGFGVPRDEESGLFWIHRAADKHFEPAVHALQIM